MASVRACLFLACLVALAGCASAPVKHEYRVECIPDYRLGASLNETGGEGYHVAEMRRVTDCLGFASGYEVVWERP